MESKGFLNLLEPQGLIRAFMEEPPEGFLSASVPVGERRIPGFITELDMFTTADKKVKIYTDKIRKFLPDFVDRILRPRSYFIGTTVSEYSVFPEGISPQEIVEYAFTMLHKEKTPLLIIKDLPYASPILRSKENIFSDHLIAHLRDRDFIILSGQTLWYVPINFGSVEEYLKRFSRSRRKDLKRKMKSFHDISIQKARTGDSIFDDAFIGQLYALYVNVYEGSDIHFDKLTKPFFRDVFTSRENNGVVFLYLHEGRIIGFNLCFIYRDFLVDKYIGFLYPEARTHNLYFLSWFHNLDFCLQNGLTAFVAGWTDPEIKASLGAEFTCTYHAVHIRNPLLRFMLKTSKGLFEADRRSLEASKRIPSSPVASKPVAGNA